MSKRIIALALAIASLAVTGPAAQERVSSFSFGGDIGLNMLAETSFSRQTEGTEGTRVRSAIILANPPSILGFNANALLGYQFDAALAVELKGGVCAYSSTFDTLHSESRRYYTSSGDSELVTANDTLGFHAFTLSFEAYARYSLSPLFGAIEGHGFQVLGGAGYIMTNANAGLRYDAIDSWPDSSSGPASPSYASIMLVPMKNAFFVKAGLEYEFLSAKTGYYIGLDAHIFPLGLIGKDIVTINDGADQRTVSAGKYDIIIPSMTFGIRYYPGL